MFPVKAMSIVYKNKFMEKLTQFLQSHNTPMDSKLRRELYTKNWVVYRKTSIELLLATFRKIVLAGHVFISFLSFVKELFIYCHWVLDKSVVYIIIVLMNIK